MSNVFSDDNKFGFKCPIFNVETKIKSCIDLRDMVWRGERPAVRKGCQACMSSSKCPVSALVQRLSFEKGYYATEYTSATPVVGRLGFEVLDRVSRVIVLDSHMLNAGVSLAERTLIESANVRIEAQLTTAPKTTKSQRRVISSDTPSKSSSRKKIVNTTSAKPATPSAVQIAAASGDMSAAINEGEAA